MFIQAVQKRSKKPIIQVKGSGNYKYKNCFIGYVLNIPIKIETDLSYEQFSNFLDGQFTSKQIEELERGM